MVELNERGLNIATANYTANVDIGKAITAYLEHVESDVIISDERKAALQTGIHACDIALENIKLKNAALREGK